MSSLDVPIFSLDASVSRKNLLVSAGRTLMLPSQWETIVCVAIHAFVVLLVLLFTS